MIAVHVVVQRNLARVQERENEGVWRYVDHYCSCSCYWGEKSFLFVGYSGEQLVESWIGKEREGDRGGVGVMESCGMAYCGVEERMKRGEREYLNGVV